MARYTKTGTPNTIGELNSQLDLIAVAIGDTLSRKGDAPNQMEDSFDVNNNRILNLPTPTDPLDVVRLKDLALLGTSGDVEGSGIRFLSVDLLIAGIAANAVVSIPALATAGVYVNTDVYSNLSGAGGAKYLLTTLVNERAVRADPTWTPDGEVSASSVTIGGSHYIGGGTEYVAVLLLDTTPNDAQFGTIGHQTSGVYDDGRALNLFFTACRKTRTGNLIIGGSQPYILPSSTFYIGETIELIDFRVDINWNGSTMRPITAITCINYEVVAAAMSNLYIRHTHLTVAEVYAAQKASITLSGGQPVSVNSESVFGNMNRILIYNPYRGFELESSAGFGGLIWQFAFNETTVWDALDWGFYFNSISQVSTTTSFKGCHTKNVFNDVVQHNSVVYRAIQHMPVNLPIEPAVTAGWENYWRVKEISNGVPAPAGIGDVNWASGTFYRTNGKGYYINNIQTCALYNCSADGGNNYTAGNVIYSLNSSITIDAFHYEGGRLVTPDNPPFLLNSDVNFGTLYLYDLQCFLPNSSDRTALIGGDLNRGRVITLQNVRNHTQNVVRNGSFDVLRLYSNGALDFGRAHTGVSINPVLVTGKEYATVYTSDQTISYPREASEQIILNDINSYHKLYEVTIPDINETIDTYIEFNDILNVSVNSGNDVVDTRGRSAKIIVQCFVQSGPTTPNRSIFNVEVTRGDSDFIATTFNTTTRLLEVWSTCKAAGQSGIVVFNGTNRGLIGQGATAVSRLLDVPVTRAKATVEAQEGFTFVGVKQKVKSVATPYTLTSADTGKWILFNSAGTGTLNVPDSLFTGFSIVTSNQGAGAVAAVLTGSNTAFGALALGDAAGYFALTKILPTIWQSSER